jgi:hypothetical protein
MRFDGEQSGRRIGQLNYSGRVGEAETAILVSNPIEE